MKKIIKLLVLAICLIYNTDNILAKEVKGKSIYIEDETIYKETLDLYATIELEKAQITIYNTTNTKYTIKLLEVKNDDAIEWLKANNIITTDEYYIYNLLILNENNEIIETPSFSYDNTLDEIYLMKIVDNNGNISQNNKIKSNNFIIIERNSKIKAINYEKTQGGSIIVDGKIIDENGIYYTSKDIIIRSDAGYCIDKVYINNVDITSKVESGILKLDEYSEINLKITFAEDIQKDTSTKYNISGKIIYNGMPLSNATIELHSNKMITKTDSKGMFYYNDVEKGPHSITVLYKENVIGYSEFKINTNDNGTGVIELNKNNEVPIDKNIILSINTDTDYKIDISSQEEYNKIDIQYNKAIVITIIIFVILLVIILFILLILKKKKEQKTYGN